MSKKLRNALLLLSCVLTGCGLGPADAQVPALVTFAGPLSTVAVGGSTWRPKARLHVAVGWIVSPSADGSTPPWLVGESAPLVADADGGYTRWQLSLRQAPPQQAFADATDVNGGSGRIAFGFLTVFEGPAPASWPADDALGGSDHIVVYWSGAAAAAIDAGTIQPGYQLMAVAAEDDPLEEREVQRLAPGAEVQLGVDSDWHPAYIRCSYELAYPTVEVFPGNEGYPSPHPPFGDVSCKLCGEHYEDVVCGHVLEQLCTECIQARVWVDVDAVSAGWPCEPAGQPCDPVEDDEPACFLGDKYSCQAGTFVLTHRCDPSADGCCENACVPVTP